MFAETMTASAWTKSPLLWTASSALCVGAIVVALYLLGVDEGVMDMLHWVDRQGAWAPLLSQVGDGAWAGFGGVVTTYQTLPYQVDAQLLYREKGRHDGYARGDVASYDASLQYRIWPYGLQGLSGTPGFVYALLESSFIHRERDEVGRGNDANSGGSQWLLAPCLQYVARRWIVEGPVQLPVAEDPNGDAIEDDYIVRVGFRRNL